MIGDSILHYIILEKLGAGGMGEVYLAEDSKLERQVAIKFLPHEFSEDETSRERFIREARSASALNHPNVCTIHSIEEFIKNGKDQNDLCIVMEYVNGTTLRKKNEEGPQKINDALKYSIQIAEALKLAHNKGIAHLDIKSDNIMINQHNQVKVMDFGLAKIRTVEVEQNLQEYSGTVAYMSPEQTLGMPASFPSDIWSFGVVIYEMLTGKLPFIHDYDEAMIYSILNEEPEPPSSFRGDINLEFENIILTCLRKRPEDRYKNIEVLLTELLKIKSELESSSFKKSFEDKKKKEVKKETEQKHATIVFMKIDRYSDLLESMDNENFVLLLEECYKIINTVTQKYGGTINKTHISDIILYFGLPVTIENSAQKAVKAVMEITESFAKLTKKYNLAIDLKLNVGINTGMVIAGSIASGAKMEYTVIGDTVELTSKLLEMCLGGQILVGPLTYKYLKNDFSFKQLKPVSAKGKRDPIKIYSLSSGNINHVSEPSKILRSKIIGRTTELTKLEEILDNTIKGEGRIVNVIAEAGIGKSRLLEEFFKSESMNDILLLKGKALSTARNISFFPIIEILRQWADINEEDDEKSALSKIEESVKRNFEEETDDIIPFIATLMGIGMSGEYEKRVNEVSGDSLNKLIQRSVRLLILKGSQVKPIIFVIEDLHWADQSSIELVQSLLRLTEKNRILFIGTMRPNYQETGDNITAFIKEKYPSFYTELLLEPLNSNNCELLLHNLLGSDLPMQLKNSISKITEGNPFFIEEVIRSLMDENVIELKDDRYTITKNIDNIYIPASIKDVLLARIDRLDESAKSLLKIASVIGRYFLYEVLVKVSGNSSEIDSLIKILESLDLINVNTQSKEREYIFKHALVQEAVYDTLLSRNKQELHLKIANAIENLFSERLQDFYETLAYHFNRADDKEKAEEYLIKAGERTLKTAASYEALNYFREALKLYLQKYGDAADREKIYMLEKNIAISYYNRAYFNDTIEHIDKALLAKGIKIRRNLISEIFRFGFNFIMLLKDLYFSSEKKKIPTEKDKELFDILYKNITAYANIDGKKMFFELLNFLRLKSGYKLSGPEEWEVYSLAISLFSYTGISFSLSEKYVNKANESAKANGIFETYNTGYDETIHRCLVGDWNKFSKVNEKLLETKLRSGELMQVIYQICWALYMVICKGEYEYAEYLINKGDEISDAYDFDYGKLYILSFRADLALNKRQLPEAIKIYDESCEFAVRIGLDPWLLGLSGKRAKAQILLDQLDSAKQSLDIAEKALLEADTLTPMLLSYYTAYNLFYHVHLYETKINGTGFLEIEKKGLEKEINKSIKKALKVSSKVAEIQPEVFRFISIYYGLKNNPSKKLLYLQKSIESAESLSALPELSRSYFEMGKFLSQNNVQNEIKNAKFYLVEAKKIFEKLDLKWDLEQFESSVNNRSIT